MIEKLFLHDFTVGNRVQSRFVHLHPLALHWAIFWCDVILEVHDETVAMGKRSFDFSAVDLVILNPPLELTPDGGDAIHALGKPWVGHGFDADDVGRI